jgi:hypothetical protein
LYEPSRWPAGVVGWSAGRLDVAQQAPVAVHHIAGEREEEQERCTVHTERGHVLADQIDQRRPGSAGKPGVVGRLNRNSLSSRQPCVRGSPLTTGVVLVLVCRLTHRLE